MSRLITFHIISYEIGLAVDSGLAGRGRGRDLFAKGGREPLRTYLSCCVRGARGVSAQLPLHVGDASCENLRITSARVSEVWERDADHRVYYERLGCETDPGSHRGSERAAAGLTFAGTAGGGVCVQSGSISGGGI